MALFQALFGSFGAVFGALLSAILLLFAGGCGGNLGTLKAFSQEFQGPAKAIVASTLDQAKWESLLAHFEGEVIEPGVEAYFGNITVVGAKMTGASGRMGVRGQGHGTEVMTDETRSAMLEWLGSPEFKIWLEKQPGKQQPMGGSANPAGSQSMGGSVIPPTG